MIGSGNFACSIVKNIGENVSKSENSDVFETLVNMWVFQEKVEVDGEEANLTDVINTKHENVKYLPGVTLPVNVVAVPEIAVACQGADIVVLCVPHQFIEGVNK